MIAIVHDIREKIIIVPPMNAIAPAAISIPKDGNNFINKLLFGFCGFEGGSKISILSSHITVFSRVFLENLGYPFLSG